LREVSDFKKGNFLEMEVSQPIKQSKTAEELAAMILEDLRKVDGCPQKGVNVTVYGIPWNALLMFDAAAGPVRNRDELKTFFEIITQRLQRLYDVPI
jgi:hypothetical protein